MDTQDLKSRRADARAAAVAAEQKYRAGTLNPIEAVELHNAWIAAASEVRAYDTIFRARGIEIPVERYSRTADGTRVVLSEDGVA
jgi:hypothetical protein